VAIQSLKKQSDFDLVNKIGYKINTPYFLAICATYPENSQNYRISSFSLGMKVSRKLGNAVIRNKIKRRIRHLVRIIQAKKGLNNSALIIIPKKNFQNIHFTTLVLEFEKLYCRI